MILLLYWLYSVQFSSNCIMESIFSMIKIWYFLYFWPNITFKCVETKIKGHIATMPILMGKLLESPSKPLNWFAPYVAVIYRRYLDFLSRFSRNTSHCYCFAYLICISSVKKSFEPQLKLKLHITSCCVFYFTIN